MGWGRGEEKRRSTRKGIKASGIEVAWPKSRKSIQTPLKLLPTHALGKLLHQVELPFFMGKMGMKTPILQSSSEEQRTGLESSCHLRHGHSRS